MFIFFCDEIYDIIYMFGVWGEVFLVVGFVVLLYMVVVMIVGIYGFIVFGGFNFIWEGVKFKGLKMSFI